MDAAIVPGVYLDPNEKTQNAVVQSRVCTTCGLKQSRRLVARAR